MPQPQLLQAILEEREEKVSVLCVALQAARDSVTTIDNLLASARKEEAKARQAVKES